MSKWNWTYIFLLLIGTSNAVVGEDLYANAKNTQLEDENLDDHEDHGEGLIHLEKRQLENLNLGIALVKRGVLNETCELTAEVRFLPQNIVHLTPRVPGIATKVNVTQGDWVVKGQILAVMESQDLDFAISEYLGALARNQLHEKTLLREKRLWERKISPEQDFLEAENHFEESKITLKVKRQSLQILGLSKEEIDGLNEDGANKILYTFKAPFDGIVTDLHISRGEYLNIESTAFVIVDPSQVWIVGQVYERDLHRVRKGQKAMVSLDAFPQTLLEGTIEYIGNSLNNETRSAETRVVVKNPDNLLKSSMFARLTVLVHQQVNADSFLIPNVGIQRSKKGHVIFKVVGDNEYQMVPVEVLAQSKDFSEVRGDIAEGDKLATGDIFILKSESEKGELGEGHSH